MIEFDGSFGCKYSAIRGSYCYIAWFLLHINCYIGWLLSKLTPLPIYILILRDLKIVFSRSVLMKILTAKYAILRANRRHGWQSSCTKPIVIRSSWPDWSVYFIASAPDFLMKETKKKFNKAYLEKRRSYTSQVTTEDVLTRTNCTWCVQYGMR